MPVVLPFADAMAKAREAIERDKVVRALDRTETRKAERAAEAAAEGRDGYNPRRWFSSDAVRQLARQRDRQEQESVKRATGVRSYTFHQTEEGRLEARRESNRQASQRRRDKKKAAAA